MQKSKNAFKKVSWGEDWTSTHPIRPTQPGICNRNLRCLPSLALITLKTRSESMPEQKTKLPKQPRVTRKSDNVEMIWKFLMLSQEKRWSLYETEILPKFQPENPFLACGACIFILALFFALLYFLSPFEFFLKGLKGFWNQSIHFSSWHTPCGTVLLLVEFIATTKHDQPSKQKATKELCAKATSQKQTLVEQSWLCTKVRHNECQSATQQCQSCTSATNLNPRHRLSKFL